MRPQYFVCLTAALLATFVSACSSRVTNSAPFTVSGIAIAMPGPSESPAPIAPPRFAVTLPPGKLPHKTNGRLIVIIAPGNGSSGGDLRDRLDDVEASRDGATFGLDANADAKGKKIAFLTTSGNVAMFPTHAANRLLPGTYRMQAVFAWNPDERAPDAPGNLSSDVQTVTIPTIKNSPIPLVLNEREDDEKFPETDDNQQWVKVRSDRLSKFYKRPIYLRAGVILPSGWKDDPTKHYPLAVRIGGFHTRYTDAERVRPHDGIVQVQLDGEGPFGDPYQVNSAVSGPYGDAVTQELLPLIESKYRCGGSENTRFVTGGSTGGWVAMALQLFYPDYFGGCWAGYPDPLDFHAYQSIDLYSDPNAYTAPDGTERISMRDRLTGLPHFTIREECELENVNGFGGSYVTSGGQWGVWNTVFGRKDRHGRAIPIWQPQTGKINRAEAEYASAHYDLTRYCSEHWSVLGPKVIGKIHLWVGERDEYFLNTGVHRFDTFLQNANPAASARIEYDPLAGHGWEPRSPGMILDEMISASSGTSGE